MKKNSPAFTNLVSLSSRTLLNFYSIKNVKKWKALCLKSGFHLFMCHGAAKTRVMWMRASANVSAGPHAKIPSGPSVKRRYLPTAGTALRHFLSKANVMHRLLNSDSVKHLQRMLLCQIVLHLCHAVSCLQPSFHITVHIDQYMCSHLSQNDNYLLENDYYLELSEFNIYIYIKRIQTLNIWVWVWGGANRLLQPTTT